MSREATMQISDDDFHRVRRMGAVHLVHAGGEQWVNLFQAALVGVRATLRLESGPLTTFALVDQLQMDDHTNDAEAIERARPVVEERMRFMLTAVVWAAADARAFGAGA